MSYVLTDDARDDLIDIYIYTLERWDEQQADRYVASLYAIFGKLRASSGRARPEVYEGIRSVNNGTHVVFFMLYGDEIAVVRVLHGARDIERLFREFEPDW
ncbi:MAG: type II toxin-antitoxin system RelE/ParE family toxin [Myxococcota bacterium]